jgi:hypothetical protein
MKNPKQLITLAAVVAMCGVLLASCGGGGAKTTTATKVEVSDSPIPNTSGMKLPLRDGGNLYALSSAEGSNPSIIKSGVATDGNKDSLVDGTFFEFSNLPATAQTKALIDKDISSVYECSKADNECKNISIKTDGTYKFFLIQDGYFYAIEK